MEVSNSIFPTTSAMLSNSMVCFVVSSSVCMFTLISLNTTVSTLSRVITLLNLFIISRSILKSVFFLFSECNWVTSRSKSSISSLPTLSWLGSFSSIKKPENLISSDLKYIPDFSLFLLSIFIRAMLLP